MASLAFAWWRYIFVLKTVRRSKLLLSKTESSRMSTYMRSRLGQDEDVIWSGIDWSIPGGGPSAIYQPPIDWSGIDWTKSGGVQITSQPAPAPTSDWWSGISKALVPLSTAAANIIRATTGQAPPPGSMYNPQTGQYVVPSQMNWLIPVLLLGGGAILLLRRKR